MATSVIDRLLIQIEANAAQLQAELAKGGESVKNFGRQTDTIAKSADGIGQRYSLAAVQIASAAENMARAGKVGGEGLKQIIVQGSNMAFMFGAQGAVVGAIGIASLAIIEVFRKTEDETRRVVEEVRRLAVAARGAAADAASTRLTTLDKDITRLKNEITDLEGRKSAAGGVLGRTGVQGEIDTRREQLAAREGDRALAQQQLQQETQRLQAEELRNLQALVRANRASTEETTRAKAIESALRGELRQTNLTLQRRVEVLGLLGDLEQKTSARRTPATASTSTSAEVDAANKALDALKAKANENREAVAAAVRKATTDLASLAGDTVLVLTQQIDELTQKFRALGASDSEILQIVAPLEAARKAATALNGAAKTISIPDSVRRELGLLPKELKVGTEGAADASQSLAAGFSDALDVALGIATAIDGASASTTRLISGAAQAASGFAKIAELATQAGGLGALFSSGAGIASALPGLGAVVGGVGSLIAALTAKPAVDPLVQQQLRLMAENNQRLADLRDGLSEVALSVGGRATAAVRDVAVQQFVPAAEGEGGIGGLGERLIPDILQDLRKAGVGLEQLRAIARDFNITLSDTPTQAELLQLQEAIKSFTLDKLTKSLQGALTQLDLLARVNPAQYGGLAGILKQIDLFAGPKGVPAIAEALKGLNLETSEGRAAAIEKLMGLLENVGSLDIGDLGSLNPDEFLQAIVELITGLQEAVNAPADQFAAALEAFGVAVELGTLTAEEKLNKARDLFATLFPELADSVDTTSADSFKASIQSIIDGFAADGVLTEAEKAQIAVLKQLAGAFDDAAGAGSALVDAFSVLEDRFVIFGTKAADQIAAILDEVTSSDSIGKNAGFALLEGLTEGLDLATEEGRAELQKRAQAIFEALSADGVTADEQAVIDILKRVLGLTKDVASEAADAASDAADAIARLAQEREKARQAILDGAEVDIKLNDVTDPVEQLGIRIRALSTAFPELGAVLGEFDTSTQEGRDALEAWIREIAGSPEALESLAAAMGVTVDELLSALVGLEEGADAATTKVATLAEKLGAAFDAADFESELEGITDPLEKLRRSAAKVSDVMPELAAIFKQFDLSTAQGRAGAEAALIALGKSTTDADVQRAVLKLLAQIRSVPVVGPSALQGTGGGLSSAAATSANVAAATSITEVTANRLVDLFGRNVVATEGILAALTGSLARTLAVPAPVTPPVLPSMVTGAFGQSASGAGSGVALSVPITLQFNGNVTTASEDELARLVQQRIYELFQGALATELQVAVRRAGLARSN